MLCTKCQRDLPEEDFYIFRPGGIKFFQASYLRKCKQCRSPIRAPLARLRSRITQQRALHKEAGLPCTLTLAEWLDTLKANDYRCTYCTEQYPAEEFILEHKLPRSLGGGLTKENIVPACNYCNARKGTRGDIPNGGFVMKVQFNTRLDQETLDKINALKDELGLSQADIVRLAVRALHYRELRDPKKIRKKTGKSA